MKYLKTINELFDDAEIKSQLEIPFLKGEIQFRNLVKDKNIVKEGDTLLAKLLINCPYISKLGFTRLNRSILNIGFKKNLNFGEGNDVLMYFVIEIMESIPTKNYICNVYAKCVGNNKDLYEEKANKGIMSYDNLVEFINGKSLNILIDFTKFTDHTFKYSGVPYKSRNYMSGLNLGRN